MGGEEKSTAAGSSDPTTSQPSPSPAKKGGRSAIPLSFSPISLRTHTRFPFLSLIFRSISEIYSFSPVR